MHSEGSVQRRKKKLQGDERYRRIAAGSEEGMKASSAEPRRERGLRVLLNATTLVKGGALQAAASFVRAAILNSGGVAWWFALSPALREQVEGLGVILPERRLRVISPTPARSKQARRELFGMEREVQPQVVFTFFGPAYVRFRAPHLCGVAVPWVTHSTWLAYWGLGVTLDLVIMPLEMLYKGLWFKKANGWVVEAPCAKAGLIKRLRLPEERICIIPNNCGEHYLGRQQSVRFPEGSGVVRVLTLSAYYLHKNLEIIPRVARILADRCPSRRFEFVVTLPYHDKGWARIRRAARALGVEHGVVNEGTVPVSAGPDLYDRCHICFLPSLLETFSANYPEAMARGLPIVTTDLPFAHDACRDAACYFIAKNARSAADAIIRLVEDEGVWQGLVARGRRVLSELPRPEEKYALYIEAIRGLVASGDRAGAAVR